MFWHRRRTRQRGKVNNPARTSSMMPEMRADSMHYILDYIGTSFESTPFDSYLAKACFRTDIVYRYNSINMWTYEPMYLYDLSKPNVAQNKNKHKIAKKNTIEEE
jgi:hypothetical protein